MSFSSSYILEYNERNYENNSRYGINVDIDRNPIEVPLSDDKVDGTAKMFNGDIVLVKKKASTVVHKKIRGREVRLTNDW